MPKAAKSSFRLTEQFISGFQNKLDVSEVPPGSAVVGSKNFALDDDGKWFTRPGSEYLGSLSSLIGNVTSAGRLRRRDGVEIPLIANGQYLRYFHPTTLDWVVLQSNFTSGQVFGFASVDRSTDTANSIVVSNGVNNYGLWLGAVAVFQSLVATTLTIQGSTNVADLGFTTTGNISVGGYEYSYTGISGLTFTGVTLTVTPSPALPAPTAGDGLAQLPVQYAGAPKGNVVLATANARVLVANVKPTTGMVGGGQVDGSKTLDPTDFTFSTPRAPSDGFIQNVVEGGGTITGLAEFEQDYYVFKAATIQKLTFSQDGNDIIQQTPLSSYDERTSSDIGSVSALAVFRMGNTICFVTPTNLITTIQRIEQMDYPQHTAISDPIKLTVDAAVFDSQTCGITWKDRAFVSCKTNSSSTMNDQILVYNQRYQVWETPMKGLNISAFFVYNGKLYGCLATAPDVVQIWTGTTDFVQPTASDIPINCELDLARQNYGSKVDRKSFQRFYVEGEMNQTGSATFSVQFDESGETRSGTLQGTESGFFFTPSVVGGFGTEPFGVDTFGPSGDGVSDSPVRFRMILTTTERPFYNFQFKVTTSSYFKLVAFGPEATMTEFEQPGSIYKAMT